MNLLRKIPARLLLARILPSLSIFFLVLIEVVPLHLPYWAMVAPFFSLAGLYFWVCARPDLLSLWMVFLLGILRDSITGGALGMSSFIFLLVYGLVVRQRHILVGKTFAVLWWGWMVVSLCAGAGFFLLHYESWQALPARAIIIQTLLSMALFPLIGGPMLRLERVILNAELDHGRA